MTNRNGDSVSDRDVRVGEGLVGGRLTSRERFRRTMHYQSVDRLPHMEFGYWDTAKDRWMKEGHLPTDLPRSGSGVVLDEAVERLFGCEQRVTLSPRIDTGPGRKREIVSEQEGKVIYRDELGILCEEMTQGIRTIPHYLDFPIKDRMTWERFRDEFLVPDASWRPWDAEELNKRAQDLRHSDLPVGVNFGSFIGRIRNWVGFEGLAYMSHDDPDLVEEMVAHLTDLKLRYLPDLLDRFEFDFASGWEDICFNSGPLLSPATFRSRIMPYVKPVMDLLRRHGIDILFTDTDGNIHDLIPLWLDAGMTCAFPFEVRPGNDPLAYRQEFGKDLVILGGFDKHCLYDTKDAVLAEFRRLEPLMAEGGFVPHIDHRCPDGIPFERYQYYIRQKCHFLGMTAKEIEEIEGLKRRPGD